MCRQLNEYLRAREDPDLDELRYAAWWLENSSRDKGAKICKLQGKTEEVIKEEVTGRKWDPLDYLLPPIPPAILPAAPLLPPLVVDPIPPPAIIPLLPPPLPTTTPLPPTNPTVPLYPTPPAIIPLPPPPLPTTTPLPLPNPTVFPVTLQNPAHSPSPTAVPLAPPSWDSSKLSSLSQSPCNPIPLLSDAPTNPQQDHTPWMGDLYPSMDHTAILGPKPAGQKGCSLLGKSQWVEWLVGSVL